MKPILPLARLRSVRDDVRSLGFSAPLRAGYEASKRLGGHSLVFGALGRARSGRTFRSPLHLPAASQVPALAAQRAGRAAKEVADGRVTLFGRSVDVGPTPDWHAVLDGPGHWPEDPWWQIDIRSDSRLSDVKWTWELGRARHLVVLARAAAVAGGAEAGSAGAAEVLRRHVASWLQQNPPERGVHWYSNLEISLRAVVWAEVLQRAGHLLPPSLVADVEEHLARCARHLVADLPYTLSTMRNNHLLGDALGMQLLQRGLGRGEGRGSATMAVAKRMFEAQAARHFRPDGSMIEDSLSYHRFVLEMLVVERLLDPAGPPRPALAASAQYLARLGVLEGPVPQYGDWDEGRVLVSTQDPHDLSGTVRCALALAGTGALAAWRAEHDECAWYAGEGVPVSPERAERDGRDIGGGIARAARGDTVLWLKAGSAKSHGHADLLSTPILWGGEWVVGDPGTGTYNGRLEQRNHFRTSVAHSVLRVDGQDQLGPHRAFRWQRTARGVVGDPLEVDGWLVTWGAHDAYGFLTPPRRVVRVVALRVGTVVVVDWAEGAPAGLATSLPLGPGCTWDAEASEMGLPSSLRLRLSCSASPVVVVGQSAPFDGWWSPTYGSVLPATRLEVSSRTGTVLWWAISTDAPPEVTELDGRVAIDALNLACTWGDGSVTLAAGRSSATVAT